MERNQGNEPRSGHATIHQHTNQEEVVTVPAAKLAVEYKLGALSEAAAMEQVARYGAVLASAMGLQISEVKVLC